MSQESFSRPSLVQMEMYRRIPRGNSLPAKISRGVMLAGLAFGQGVADGIKDGSHIESSVHLYKA